MKYLSGLAALFLLSARTPGARAADAFEQQETAGARETAQSRVWLPISTGLGFGNLGLAAWLDFSPHYLLFKNGGLGIRSAIGEQTEIFGGGLESYQVGPSVMWLVPVHPSGRWFAQGSFGYSYSTLEYEVECRNDFCLFGNYDRVNAPGVHGSFKFGYLYTGTHFIGGLSTEANILRTFQIRTTPLHATGTLNGVVGMRF